MSVSSFKHKFARNWQIKSENNDWPLLELVSSLDENAACDCCGKGKSNGRPLCIFHCNTCWDPKMKEDKTICLFCAEGVMQLDADVINHLRSRYRDEYNAVHLGELTEVMHDMQTTHDLAADYMDLIRDHKTIPPKLLASARTLAYARSRK